MYRDLPVSASSMLRLKVYATMPDLLWVHECDGPVMIKRHFYPSTLQPFTNFIYSLSNRVFQNAKMFHEFNAFAKDSHSGLNTEKEIIIMVS